MMQRYAAGVEYDGSRFSGWQRQHHTRTVQAAVEGALSAIANHPISVTGSGRTDAGVHATGQVIHFDSDAVRTERSWLLGSNTHLDDDVVLRWVRPVGPEFHARYSARSRHYRYTILNRPTRPAIGRQFVTAERQMLEASSMHKAAQSLIGEHDFSAFRAAACQSHTPMRQVQLIRVWRADDYVNIDVVANAFLHHMVRNIVGVLIDIGIGKRALSWASDVLASQDRTAGGITAPASGLGLMGVCYPDAFELPLNPVSRMVFAAIGL